MSSTDNSKLELPDLGLKDDSLETELTMEEYQNTTDQEGVVNAIIINNDNAEVLQASEDESYLADDMEVGESQQFLTINQGNSKIAVNDNGTIVYSNASFMEGTDTSANPEELTTDSNTMYYQDVNVIQEPELMQVDDGQHEGSIIDQAELLQAGQTFTIPAGTILDPATLQSLVALQTDQRKRTLPASPQKPMKVFIQSSMKNQLVANSAFSNYSGRKMTLSQAQRLGLVSPNLKHVIASAGAGSSGKIVVKKIPAPAGTSVLTASKSPTKILPAPTRPGEKLLLKTTSVAQPFRTTIPSSQLKTIFTTSTAQPRPASLVRTTGHLSLGKIGSPGQKVVVQATGASNSQLFRLPVQVPGKPQVKYVQLLNPDGPGLAAIRPKPSTVSLASAKSTFTTSNSIRYIDASTVEKTVQDKVPEKVDVSKVQVVDLRDGETLADNTVLHDVIEELEDDFEEPIENPDSPQRVLEANGIRPKKPCNCTRSQCLKLYCECFANGEFCFQCNCNNCYNNIEHEEDRQQSIKACLERNPDAFKSKICVIDSDDEEGRRVERGCNCKRTACLKNYCECYEGKVACGKNCKCVDCRNTEDERPWAKGEGWENDSSEKDKGTAPFMSEALAEALCQCILVQAEAAERKGDDMITTEQKIIEELGQRLVQIIGNRSKKDSRKD